MPRQTPAALFFCWLRQNVEVEVGHVPRQLQDGRPAGHTASRLASCLGSCYAPRPLPSELARACEPNSKQLWPQYWKTWEKGILPGIYVSSRGVTVELVSLFEDYVQKHRCWGNRKTHLKTKKSHKSSRLLFLFYLFAIWALRSTTLITTQALFLAPSRPPH